jgi:hypothetical protein
MNGAPGICGGMSKEPIQGSLHCPFGCAQGSVEMTGAGLRRRKAVRGEGRLVAGGFAEGVAVVVAA